MIPSSTRVLCFAAAVSCLLVGATADLARAESEPGRIAVMADMGVPDGFIGALVVHAHRQIAVHAGGGHNSISPGVRAGVQVHALDRAITPYLAVEGGHYVAGHANDMARELALQAGLDAGTELEQLGYSYANGHLGLKLGSAGAAFYIQAGLSYVRTSAATRDSRGLEMAPTTTVDVRTDSVFRIWTPSGRIGLIAYY